MCQTSAERPVLPHREQGSFSAACWLGTGFSTQDVAALIEKDFEHHLIFNVSHSELCELSCMPFPCTEAQWAAVTISHAMGDGAAHKKLHCVQMLCTAKCLSICRFHPISLSWQDSMSESLQTCYKYLNETGRSYAPVIQAVEGELRWEYFLLLNIHF